MKWKEFLEPNKKIAMILIFTPLLIFIVSQLFAYFLSSNDANFLSIFIGPIIPALFMAAAFHLKFKKNFSYYLTFYLPFTIYQIAGLIVIGAFPLMQIFQPQASSFSLFVFFFSPIIIYLALNPFFFLLLPSKLTGWGRYAATFLSSLFYLIVVKYVFLIISSFLSTGSFNYSFSFYEMLSNALYIVIVLLYSTLFFMKFRKILRKR